MKIEECMFGNGLKVGWLKPFQYISAYSFIEPENWLEMYHTSVGKKSYERCSMSRTQDVFCCLLS